MNEKTKMGTGSEAKRRCLSPFSSLTAKQSPHGRTEKQPAPFSAQKSSLSPFPHRKAACPLSRTEK